MIDLAAVSGAEEDAWDLGSSTSNFEYLSNLGRISPWLLIALTGAAIAAEALLAKKRAKPLGVHREEKPLEPTHPNARESRGKEPRMSLSQVCSQVKKSACYEDLPCSSKERSTIEKILTILDTDSALSIIPKISLLRALENQIDHLHPLKFLGIIFSEEKLKQKVNRIFQDQFKGFHQQGFLMGIEKGMGRYSVAELNPYLDGWARSIGATREEVAPLIQSQEWGRLVRHCLNLSHISRA